VNIFQLINKTPKIFSALTALAAKIDIIQQAVGKIEERQLNLINSNNIHDNEFKVSSQNGEDGIIQFLTRKMNIPNKTFVEFGVQDYGESNTRFLLRNSNWSGLVIDGSEDHIKTIKADDIYWRHNLKADCSFIDKDNINSIISRNGLQGDIGILSVDIDGNDYWVWEAIECVKPRIVICEYNSVFGSKHKISSIYDSKFFYGDAHYSRLYWGASISAFDYLAKQKGYSLVGSNTVGNNIFFVRNDALENIPTYTPEEAYVRSQFRISYDQQGNLSYLDFNACISLIGDMTVCDVETGGLYKVKDLDLTH
jgi:hypothetical protein